MGREMKTVHENGCFGLLCVAASSQAGIRQQIKTDKASRYAEEGAASDHSRARGGGSETVSEGGPDSPRSRRVSAGPASAAGSASPRADRGSIGGRSGGGGSGPRRSQSAAAGGGSASIRTGAEGSLHPLDEQEEEEADVLASRRRSGGGFSANAPATAMPII